MKRHGTYNYKLIKKEFITRSKFIMTKTPQRISFVYIVFFFQLFSFYSCSVENIFIFYVCNFFRLAVSLSHSLSRFPSPVRLAFDRCKLNRAWMWSALLNDGIHLEIANSEMK